MGEIRTVTFASEEFIRAAKFATRSLSKFGIKDNLIVTPQNFYSLFSNERLINESLIDFSSRGAGFWRWKPAIIESLLNKMNFGDILLYFDSRVVFKREYITFLLSQADQRISLFENIQKNNQIEKWTDPLVLNQIDTLGGTAKKNMILAGVISVPKSQENMRIIREWHNLCANKSFLSPDDDPRYIPHDPCIWHRHDQSLLSIVVRNNEPSIKVFPYYVGLRGIVLNQLIFHRILNPCCLVLIHFISAFQHIRRTFVDCLPKSLRIKLRYLRTKNKVSPSESERHIRFF